MNERSVAILGAGAMGSALAAPLRSRGWDVRLWGTWLDDALLEACRAGAPHPRTNVPLAEGTKLFGSDELAAALDGVEFAVLAVASVGVQEVVRRAASSLAGVRALLLTSKGFAFDDAGRVVLLPEAIRQTCAAQGVTAPPIVAVGGPCKANEVAAGRPTATIFGCADGDLAREVAAAASTAVYRAEAVADEAGVELCAPMKNVYAIALGMADGLGERGGEPWHDLKAAVFTQAVREMRLLSDLVGGHPETAIGLAGVGDLEVTGLSGRNKVYGVRIGRGESAQEALAAMAAAEQTVEGAPACDFARLLVDQRDPGLWSRLPLLRAISATLSGADNPTELVTDAVLPTV